MDEEVTCWIDLPGDRRVRVRVSVNTGPAIAAPHEADVLRTPTVEEWVEIIARLEGLDINRIETGKARA